MKADYFHTMPNDKITRQIEQLRCPGGEALKEVEVSEEKSDEEIDWELPTPDYTFPKRARIVDAFYALEAESLTGEAAVLRRLQVTFDIVALCKLQ